MQQKIGLFLFFIMAPFSSFAMKLPFNESYFKIVQTPSSRYVSRSQHFPVNYFWPLKLVVRNFHKSRNDERFLRRSMSTMNTKTISPRSIDFSKWYQDIIVKADLAEHSPVRGCMIIRPLGTSIWERIQKDLDAKIKQTGHENVYFPMLIPISFFEREANHIDGFAKECAVVTHHRLEQTDEKKLIPSPAAKLEEPLVIRPTSETLIGDAMSRWVSSYRDLPIKINQWCNVMRWELRPRLFLRTSEFLWQEGHTAHASSEEANSHAISMLELYESYLQNYLAIPVIKGSKTSGEKFPGASATYTLECMMQDGKALQAGTSHFLGQNFSRAYKIEYFDADQQKKYAWTTSWGVTTRLIGALIMTHSDDDGLVLPPRIAPHQLHIIPIIKNENDAEQILEFCNQLSDSLQQVSFFDEKLRVKVDNSNKRPVDKFWNTIKQGIPLRLEIGMKEVLKNSVCFSRRDKPSKERVNLRVAEFIPQVTSILTEMQLSLFQKASERLTNGIVPVSSLAELSNMFAESKNSPYNFATAYIDLEHELAPKVAEVLKGLKISIRCIPFKDRENLPEGTCIFTGNKTFTKAIFGLSY